MAGNFKEAIEYIKDSTLAKDEKSKLLFFTETGLLEHYQGNYIASNDELYKAKQLIDEQFTTKVSGKISSVVTNDNSDFYYGEKYEASLVYFYLTLNDYLLSFSEADPELKRKYLESARAHVVEWDSFLNEMKLERLGKAYFKEDLLAKTFGALVHEAQNNPRDTQIALQLYKDAADVFFKNYNLFPSFNSAYNEFGRAFTSFPNISKSEIEKKYVLKTQHALAFEQFLKNKIESLSQKKAKSTITFLVQDGLIVEKKPHRIELPITWGTHHGSAMMLRMGGHITFELPSIDSIPVLEESRLEALDTNGKVIATSSLPIIAPISELAAQAVNEHSTAIAAKTASRVAAKHIAAVVAAGAAYESARRNNNALGMSLATIGHAAAMISINESEKADVRYWSTLPSNIRMGNITVPEGTYSFRAVFGKEGAQEYRVIELGQHTVEKTIKLVMNSKNQKNNSKSIAITLPATVSVPDRNPSNE